MDIATSCLLYFWEMWLVLFVCTESISANAFYDICQFFSSVVPNSKDHRVPMGKGYQLNISHGHLKRNIIQNTWALLPTAKSTQYLWSNVVWTMYLLRQDLNPHLNKINRICPLSFYCLWRMKNDQLWATEVRGKIRHPKLTFKTETAWKKCI